MFVTPDKTCKDFSERKMQVLSSIGLELLVETGPNVCI